MLRILFVDIFYPKVVNDQAATDGACVVLPQARGYSTLGVPVLHEALFKEFLGNYTGLWQAIHSFFGSSSKQIHLVLQLIGDCNVRLHPLACLISLAACTRSISWGCLSKSPWCPSSFGKCAAAEHVNCLPLSHHQFCNLHFPFFAIFQSHFHVHCLFLVLRANCSTKQNRITGCHLQ